MRIIGGKHRGTKIETLPGENTRPTHDRVREAIFNIIQNETPESTFLDLFSGSGAIGLEAVSRGAKKALLCDNSKEAIEIIKRNAKKTHSEENVEICNMDFKKMIQKISKEKIDIVYIDPPYKTNYVYEALKNLIEETECIKEESIIIIETDEPIRIKEQINKLEIEITDERKYGRANLIFARKKIG